MDHPIRILLVEDDEDDIVLLKAMMSERDDTSLQVSWEYVYTLESALKRLNSPGIDFILLDLRLPDSQGLATLRKVLDKTPHIPIVVLSTLNDKDFATKAVIEGAQDYLVKGGVNRWLLSRTISHAFERHRIQEELKQANARLEEMAFLDSLTQLLNRRGFEHIFEKEIDQNRRDHSEMAVILIDVDDFKNFNEKYGHAVGDKVLQEIGRQVKGATRATDSLSRVGGDEFLVLLPSTRMAEAARVAEKIRLGISHARVELPNGEILQITGSLSLAPVVEETQGIDDLLKLTHTALAKSKKSGKNRVSQGSGQAVDGILSEIAQGKGLRAVRQPIFFLKDLSRVGYEFLTRTSIPSYEMPGDLFPLCQEVEDLAAVDKACLRNCIAAAEKSADGATRTHVNMLPATLLTTSTEEILKQFPSDRKRENYCIEINENQIVGDPGSLVKPLDALKRAGFLIALDNIGFGRSCLETLVLLEPHIIKIDRRCVTGVSKDPARARSLQRIVNVAKTLKAEVMAQGIESEADLDVLKQMGVRYGQGYHLAKPV